VKKESRTKMNKFKKILSFILSNLCFLSFNSNTCNADYLNFSPVVSVGNGGYGNVYKYILDGTCEPYAFKYCSGGRTSEEVLQPRKISKLFPEGSEFLNLPVNFGQKRVLVNGQELEENCLIFKYIPFTLSRLRTKCDLTEPVTKHIIFRLLKGLEELHSKNIIWGDLKESNILIDRKYNAYLADFGGSLIVNSEVVRDRYGRISLNKNPVAITPAFFPLKFKQSQYIDFTTDIYMLGILWISLLTSEKVVDLNNYFAVPERYLDERIRTKVNSSSCEEKEKVIYILSAMLKGKCGEREENKITAGILLSADYFNPEEIARELSDRIIICPEGDIKTDNKRTEYKKISMKKRIDILMTELPKTRPPSLLS